MPCWDSRKEMVRSMADRRPALSLGTAMILIAGAAVGLALLRLMPPPWELFDWRSWMAAFYAALSGVTMAVAVLLIVARLRGVRRWRTGAMACFTMGTGLWLFAPIIPMDRLLHHGFDAPFIYSFYFQPILGLLLFLAGVVAGKPVPRWWTCRGWWPEWLGMWVLVAWSVAGAFLLLDCWFGWPPLF